MRIYSNCREAVREVERDLWEMGLVVHPQSMQDKVVKDDEDYKTKELQAYGFQIVNPSTTKDEFVKYLFPDDAKRMLEWCHREIKDRTSVEYINPGETYKIRDEVWGEFVHDGKFAYTYNERIRTQLYPIIEELRKNPNTRQAIIEMHNNVIDLPNLGGKSRIPCSMYYQFLVRNGKLDVIYTMRSNDFLTHFAFDNWMAISLGEYIARQLRFTASYDYTPPSEVGRYTFFAGSLHAYYKDMKVRGIF